MEILSEDEQMLLDSAAGYLAKNQPINAFRALRDAPTESGFDLAAFKEMSELGWMGLVLPEQVGGSEFGNRAAGLIAEQLGRNLTAIPFISTAILSTTILRQIGGKMLEKWGEKIALGECIMALAVDSGAKHLPNKPNVKAVQDGEAYILNGAVDFVIDGIAADQIIVCAILNDEIALFMVNAADQVIWRQKQVMIDSRVYAELSMTDLKLNVSSLIVCGDEAQNALNAALRAGRAVVAAEQIGIARECAARTIEYLSTRKQFGVVIGVFQTLQHRMAHLYCEIEQTASLVAAALRAIDEGSENAEALSRAAKAKAAKVCRLATEEAVQMYGGIGMTDEMDFGLFMKRNRVLTELLGDANHHIDWLLRNKNI